MKAALEKKLIAGIAIAIVSVLAIVVISLNQSRRLQDNGSIVRHSNQILYQAQDVLDLGLQYELGIKDFLLTHDSSFLDTAGRFVPPLQEGITHLKTLTADNPGQQARLALVPAYTPDNREYARQLRTVIREVVNEEVLLLDQRRKKSQHTATQLQIILWTLIAAVAILAWAIFQKIRLDLAKNKEAREQLKRNNQELTEEVQLQMSNLQLSEEKYKTLFYKSPMPKWIYDMETLSFLEVNEKAIEHYGYSQEEFRRMTLRDIRPSEDRGRLDKDLDQLRTTTEAYHDAHWRHLKKNGDLISVEITAHLIDYEGRKARMVVVNDITDKVRSEMLLQQLNEDLEKRAAELGVSNTELERFAYIASHDLQEPLRMVSSFLQLLQKKYKGRLDAKADQYIHYAVDGAERMKALIMDLLEYSRVGVGKESFGPVRMDGIFVELEEVFRSTIIELRARIEVGDLPVVRGDRVQLTQLFQNLVGNALKYHSERPPQVCISAKEETGFWRFEVSDNGIGIDPLFFDKIFIIFQRLNNKSDYSGTGIGLAICKKIVDRHGGRIWVESVPGEGSRFFFTIAK
jgi:PAS domain S-box-containing protein